MQFFVQHPGTTIEYQINWTDELGDGITISGSAWTATPTLTLTSLAIDGSFTALRVAGVATGTRYELKNTITLSNSEVLVDYLFIYCEA